MIWVVYISDKPNSRTNFPIGIHHGVWGIKEQKKGTVQDIKKGDIIAFVYSISWLKAEGTPPPGFSRVGKEDLNNFRGLVQNIIIGQVTKDYYTSYNKIWPDDEIYPHRFDFKIVRDYGENIYFGTEFFNQAFVEAVRYSACTQGSITAATSIELLADIDLSVDEQDFEENTSIEASGFEGKPIMRLHQFRERNTKIVKQRLNKALNEYGKLECEVCKLDFETVYGELGHGFAECHHINPLSLRDRNEKTYLSDLAIVCSNCHRMLHRKRPWLTINELRDIFKNQNPDKF